MKKDLTKLMFVCAGELQRLDVDWAVGGALAMAAQGYTRETKDIDLFIDVHRKEEVIEAITNALGAKKTRLEVDTVFEDVHYAIIPDKKFPEERLDLLFPSSDPDVSAIAVPDYALVEGKRLPVWPMTLIVANKLIDGREKDATDLIELRNRGLVDGPEVLKILRHMDEDQAVRRLQVLMRDEHAHERVVDGPSRPGRVPEGPSRTRRRR